MVPKFDSVMVAPRRSAGVRLRSCTPRFAASIWRRQSSGRGAADIAQHRNEQSFRAVDGKAEIDGGIVAQRQRRGVEAGIQRRLGRAARDQRADQPTRDVLRCRPASMSASS